ncbi:MAG: protein kinase, partial [Candidatus Marinimicrobia bacterium]|nr:protein kinase [Candidatus Neomarinimicrobiota bacterium]
MNMIGKTISHYKILEKLGEGGMGVVYKAEDTKLKRTVALKFLPPELTRDEEAKERFVHEAQAASALEHNNICNIHEIDETDDRQTFIVMACYEGETLKHKIERGPFKLEESIDITIQIAEGLAKAHEQGIVHRDIKSANLYMTKDDVVKILDFGLAKLRGQTKLTKEGTTLGTAAYMSPEQTRGEDVDHRTDIWSLGVVLYEMLTGQLPFKGEYEQAVIYSILNEDPEPVKALRTGIPMELERILNKALLKNAGERYQLVDKMLDNMRWLQKSLEIGIIEQRLTKIISPYRYRIAVLPLTNIGPNPEDEYFADGMTEELISTLSKINELRVIARTSIMQYKNIAKSVAEIGRELKVGNVLEGSIRKAADKLRITVQLIDSQSQEYLWSQDYDREFKDIFTIQSDIAHRVADALRVQLMGGEQK